MHLDIIKNKLKFLKEIMWLRNLMQSLDILKKTYEVEERMIFLVFVWTKLLLDYFIICLISTFSRDMSHHILRSKT